MRRRSEQELKKSEVKYRNIVDNSIVGVFHSRLNGEFIFSNDALAQMFDFDSSEQMMAEGTLPRWSNPNQREQWMAALQEHGSVRNFEIEAITHTGRKIHLLFSSNLIADNILGMVMDITKRKQAQEQINNYQERLKALASQLTITEEKERRRIAADLHDQIGQSLALARIQIAAAKKSAADDGLAAKLDDVSEILREAVQDTRHLIFDLSPPVMHEIGLGAAISEWLDDQIGKRYCLKTEFFDKIDQSYRKTLDENVRAILFRNVRELLINVVKHARANQVSVSMEVTDDVLKIVVQDDGVGFDFKSEFQKVRPESGFGLFSIKERMADLGGTLEIEPEPGKGCKTILTVPLSIDDDKEIV